MRRWKYRPGNHSGGLAGITAASALAELYFNLMAEDLAGALAEGARDVEVGQTSDEFKSRLGCQARPRYVYVRGMGAIADWLVRRAAGWFFPPPAPPPRRDLFRRPPLDEKSRSKEPRQDGRGREPFSGKAR